MQFSCPSSGPSQALARQQLICWGSRVRNSLNSVQTLFSNTWKTGVLPLCVCNTWCVVLVTNLKHSTVWTTMKKTLSQPNPAQSSYISVFFFYCNGGSGKFDLGEMCQFNVFSMLDDKCWRDHPIHKGLDISARNLSHHFHLGFAPVSQV